MKYILRAAIISAMWTAPAVAQDHSTHQHGGSPFAAINADMHKSMDVEFSGDIDTDFVRSMIPHHQGAVDMAKVVLEQGKDPEIRALAEQVVKTQESEIAQMKAWLEKHSQ